MADGSDDLTAAAERRRAAGLRATAVRIPPSDEDARFIEAYLRGDPGALERVELCVRTELHSRYMRLQDEFDDIAQTVHEKLLASLREGRFRGSSALRTYLISIIHHTAIDRLRERYHHRVLSDTLALPPTTDPSNPFGRIEELEDAEFLAQLVQILPAPCRELWHLVFVEKACYREIAVRLSIPEGTVKSRMWHCRCKAMELLVKLRKRRKARGGKAGPQRH